MNRGGAALKTSFRSLRERAVAGRFGMGLFLASLGMLFAASVIGFVVIRVQLEGKGLWPRDLPPLPAGLAASTVILLVSSGTMHAALLAARAGRGRALRAALLATTVLGLAFLSVQALCWFERFGAVADRWHASDEWRLALTGFYVLSGLHAAHVVGGLIGLLVTTARAFAGAVTPDDHRGVVACAMYWHFLDAVWLCLYALLLV